MTLDQLQGKYARLKRELAQAYAAPQWDGAWIDRIAEDLIATERALERRQSEQVEPRGGLNAFAC